MTALAAASVIPGIAARSARVAEFGSTIPPEAVAPDAGAAGAPPAAGAVAGGVVAAGGAVAVLIAAVSIAAAAVSVESAFFIVQPIVATSASEATTSGEALSLFIGSSPPECSASNDALVELSKPNVRLLP
jgi:hypothetical protein